MKTKLRIAVSAAVLLAALSLLGTSGCLVRTRPGRVTVRGPAVRVSTPSVRVAPVVVRVRPPAPRVEVRRACPRGSYWKVGRWQWNGRRWVWLAGGCKRYPHGRIGCAWVGGHWARTPRGWRWSPGRWRCGAGVRVRPGGSVTVSGPGGSVSISGGGGSVTVSGSGGTVSVSVPTVAPPAPPRVRVRRCPRHHYWRPGRYQWRGRWVWMAGRCVPRPRAYRRATCIWVRGHWVRRGRGWHWAPGRWRCRR